MKKINLAKLKHVGIIRALDGLGRLSIPIEMRKVMGIKEDDALEQKLCQDEDGEYVIVVRKWRNDDE